MSFDDKALLHSLYNAEEKADKISRCSLNSYRRLLNERAFAELQLTLAYELASLLFIGLRASSTGDTAILSTQKELQRIKKYFSKVKCLHSERREELAESRKRSITVDKNAFERIVSARILKEA